MVLLDTDVVIDYMHGQSAAVDYVEAIVQGPEPLAISTVTIMQLHEGVGRSRMPAQEASLISASLAGFASLVFDEACAVEAGRILAALSDRGRPIGVTDVMIGATATRHGLAVATRNRKHFERMPGVRLASYH